MKIGTLFKLAKQNDPKLAQYARRWVERNAAMQKGGSGKKVSDKDPVTQALNWKDDVSAFLGPCPLVCLTVAIVFLPIAHLPVLRSDTLWFDTVMGLVLCSGAFAGCLFTLCLCLRLFGMPQDTKEFLAAISLLECFGRYTDSDGRLQFLGPFENWYSSNEGSVNEAARGFLSEAARKIMAIESAKDSIPWRVEEKEREIQRTRDLFARHQRLLLKFADVPEDWGYYFKR